MRVTCMRSILDLFCTTMTTPLSSPSSICDRKPRKRRRKCITNQSIDCNVIPPSPLSQSTSSPSWSSTLIICLVLFLCFLCCCFALEAQPPSSLSLSPNLFLTSNHNHHHQHNHHIIDNLYYYHHHRNHDQPKQQQQQQLDPNKKQRRKYRKVASSNEQQDDEINISQIGSVNAAAADGIAISYEANDPMDTNNGIINNNNFINNNDSSVSVVLVGGNPVIITATNISNSNNDSTAMVAISGTGTGTSGTVTAAVNSSMIVNEEHLCPRNRDEAVIKGRTCLRKCSTDVDCISSRKRCLCDGMCGWSCVRPDLNCDEIGDFPNGRYYLSLGGAFFNSKVTYDCDPGFYLSGARQRICQGDSSWSDLAPECKIRPVCSLPPGIPHSKHSASESTQTEFELNTTLVYECFNGYEMIGNPTAVCLFRNNTTNWFGPELRCNPISCGDPEEIENGYRDQTGQVFTSRVNYFCNDGYVLAGRAIRYCQSNGQWSGDLPSCQPIKCPQPEDPKNGRAFYDTGYTFGSMVTYQCKPGFQLHGPSNRTCQADKSWSDDDPVCKIIDCGPPGPFPNGYIEAHSTTIGSVIKFFCLDDMVYEGNFNQSICSVNGTWHPWPFPRCQAGCLIPKIPNGKVLDHVPMIKVPHRYRINVTCISEYELETSSSSSSPSSTILSMTTTSTTTTTTTPVSTSVTSSSSSSTSTTSAAVNQTTVQCYNGTWIQLPRCVPARCRTLPPRPKFGLVIAPKTDHGMRALYRCRDGYQLQGSNMTWCHFGRWNMTTPTCSIIYCPFPGYIDNGKVLLVGQMGMYDYKHYVRKVGNNRQILFECDRGYHITSGPPGSTCIAGQWQPSALPVCEQYFHPKTARWSRSLNRRRNDVNTSFRSASKPHHHMLFSRSSSIINTSSLAANKNGIITKHRHKRHQASKIKSACSRLPEKPFTKISIIKFGKDLSGGTAGNETYPHGTRIKLVCEDGYVLSNPNRTIIKCAKGRWKPELPNCTPAPCITPTVANSQFRIVTLVGGKNRQRQKVIHLTPSQLVAHGQNIELHCENGYHQQAPTGPMVTLSMSMNRLVANRKVNTRNVNRIKPLWKSLLPTPQQSSSSSEALVTLRCSYGSWDYSAPAYSAAICEPKPCMLPSIAHGHYTNGHKAGQTVLHGTMVQYGCDDGFERKYHQYKTAPSSSNKISSIESFNSSISNPSSNDHPPINVTSIEDSLDTTTTSTSRCMLGKLEPPIDMPYCIAMLPASTLAAATTSPTTVTTVITNTSTITDVTNQTNATFSTNYIVPITNNFSSQNLLHRFDVSFPPSSLPLPSTLSSSSHRPCHSPQKIENALRYFGELFSQRMHLIGIAQFDNVGQSSSPLSLPSFDIGAKNQSNATPPNEVMQFQYDHGTEIKFRCVNYAKPGQQQSQSQQPQQSSNGIESQSGVEEFVRSTWIIRCENSNWIGRSFECEDYSNHSDGGNGGGGDLIASSSSSLISDKLPAKQSPCYLNSIVDTNVWLFNGSDQQERIENFSTPIPHDNWILIRCKDVGRFALNGPRQVICRDGRLHTPTAVIDVHSFNPTCVGLGQEYDYDVDKPPTITFRYQFGPIAQTPEGKLLVYPGTVLHLECLWKRRHNTPHWSWTHPGRSYQQYWTTEPGRDSSLEYVLTIFHAQERDSGTYTCQTPKSHSHSVEIVVKAVQCPSLQNFTTSTNHTRVIVTTAASNSNDDHRLNAEIHFACPMGNTMIGQSVIICQPNGQWSAPVPKCVVTECPDLAKHLTHPTADHQQQQSQQHLNMSSTTKIVPAEILQSSRKVGDKAIFTCPKGYGLQSASHELYCLDTGSWSGPVPVCVEVHCPPPQLPDKGFLEPGTGTVLGSYTAGDMVQFGCEYGYALEGNPLSICQENGRWSGPMPRCQAACTYPGLAHGARLVSEIRFFYPLNQTVQFECAEGYLMRGPAVIKCIDSGRWSGPIPECVAI